MSHTRRQPAGVAARNARIDCRAGSDRCPRVPKHVASQRAASASQASVTAQWSQAWFSPKW